MSAQGFPPFPLNVYVRALTAMQFAEHLLDGRMLATRPQLSRFSRRQAGA
jgi:hypothetical protein